MDREEVAPIVRREGRIVPRRRTHRVSLPDLPEPAAPARLRTAWVVPVLVTGCAGLWIAGVAGLLPSPGAGLVPVVLLLLALHTGLRGWRLRREGKSLPSTTWLDPRSPSIRGVSAPKPPPRPVMTGETSQPPRYPCRPR